MFYFFPYLSVSLGNRTITSSEITPRIIVPRNIAPRIIGPHIIALQDNTPWIISLMIFLPQNSTKQKQLPLR